MVPQGAGMIGGTLARRDYLRHPVLLAEVLALHALMRLTPGPARRALGRAIGELKVAVCDRQARANRLTAAGCVPDQLTSRGGPGAWRVPVVFVCALVYLAGGIRVRPGGDRPPFASDEAHKLSESYYYHLFFEEGAWRHPDWQADFYARTNLPVAKYVFGAALAAAGWHVRDHRLQEDFGALWRTRDGLRRKVPDPVLRVARGVSAAYGALVCALLFWIGQRAGGPLAGLLAALLLLTNPNFLAAARRGLTDTILLFHLTLIVPASLWSVRTLRERSGWGRLLATTALVPGLVVALATGSKMNGALTAPVYAASLVLAAVVEPGAWR